MGSITRTCNIGHNTTVTSNYYLCVDATIDTGDTTDWITVLGSTTNTFQSSLIVNIGTNANPGVNFGHYIDIRHKKLTPDLSYSTHKIELRLMKAGTILIATTGLISSEYGVFNTSIQALTPAEVDKIENNYSDLSFHIIGYGHDSLSTVVPWVRLRYPKLVPC